MTPIRPPHKTDSYAERRSDVGYAAIIIAAVFFIWKAVIALGTVNWDDPEYILQNPFLQNPGSILFGFYMGNYHPITLYSLYLDSVCFGTQYSLWHISSLLLHSINAVVLYFLLRTLGIAKLSACGLTLLWAVLPVHAESISWLSARKDLLYTGFGLTSVGLMIQYANTGFRHKAWYFAAILLFLLACLSKAMAVSLALWIPILLYPNIQSIGWKKFSLLLLPFVCISIIIGMVAISAQQSAGAIDMGVRSHAPILISIESMGLLLSHILYPSGLSPFYPYPDSLPGYGTLLLLGIILLSVAFWFTLPKYRNALIGILLFGVCALPVSQLLPVGSAITADRYAYAAAAGLCIGLGLGLRRYNHAGLLLLLPILLLAWLSKSQIPIWRNGIQVFERVVLLYPQTAFAWNNLGNAYAEIGDAQQASAAFQKAVAADSSYAPGLLNLAAVMSQTGQTANAIALYQRIPQQHALYPSAGIRSLQLEAGAHPQIQHLAAATQLLRQYPSHAELWYLSGNIFQNAHRHAQALVCYHHSLILRPAFQDALLNQAISFTETQQADKAIATFGHLLPTFSQPGVVYANWAWALYRQQQFPEALEKAALSVQVLPGIPALWFNYGLIAFRCGQDSLAQQAYQSGMRLAPDTAALQQAVRDLNEAGISGTLPIGFQ